MIDPGMEFAEKLAKMERRIAELERSSGSKPGPWIDLTMLTGWTEAITCQARREGDIVRVIGRLSNASGGGLTNTSPAFNLPAGLRPASNKTFDLPDHSSPVVRRLWVVETGGNVRPGLGHTVANGELVVFDAGFTFPLI